MNLPKIISNPKISVGLYINGDDLDPEEVTLALKEAPTSSFKKGDEVGGASRKNYVRPHGHWERVFDTEDLSEIDVRLGGLASLLVSSEMPSNVSEVYIDIFVAIESQPDGRSDISFEASSSVIQILGSAGVPVKFTFAGVPC